MSRFSNDTWRCFQCGAENSLQVDPCRRCGKSHLPQAQPVAVPTPAPPAPSPEVAKLVDYAMTAAANIWKTDRADTPDEMRRMCEHADAARAALLAEFSRLSKPQAQAPESTKAYRLRQLAQNLLRSAINIAEEKSPKWYKNSDEKIAAILALKDQWDTEATTIAATPKGTEPPARPMKLRAEWDGVNLKVWADHPETGRPYLYLHYDMVRKDVPEEIAYRINSFEPTPLPDTLEGDKPTGFNPIDHEQTK